MNLSSLIGHTTEILQEVDRTTLPPDRFVAEFFRKRKYLGSHDRKFIAESVFGIIRHRRLLEALLEGYLNECPSSSDLDQSPSRYLSLYVIYSHHQDLTVPAERIVPTVYWNTFFPRVELETFLHWMTVHQSLDFLGDDEIVRLGVQYSFQDWMVNEWLDSLGGETPVLLDSLNQQAPITLRVNTLRTDRDECRGRLQSVGLETTPTTISPAGLVAGKRFNLQATSAFREGLIELQDEGSQMISFIADPQPGMVVVDACAGGGGKTLHLAEIMKNRGEIIALDVDQTKLSELRTRSERGGHTIITTMVRDDECIARLRMKADLVLVDAPCSGTGTIRRNPWVKWRVDENIILRFSQNQLQILSEYSECVKPGGRLVYSTCSLFRTENEFVVNEFLNSHSSFTLSSTGIPIPGNSPDKASPFIYLYPHRNGTDGFFVTMMNRIQ